jgi:hypothetical protein
VRPVAATVTALALSLAMVLGLGACKPSSVTDRSRKLYCQVVPDAPKANAEVSATRVVGTVRFYCDPPGVDRLSLTLRIQRQNAKGAWVNVVSKVFTASGSATLPVSYREVYRSRQVSAPCGSGVYRTVVTGTSTARGFTSHYDLTGPRSSDPCRPGIFAP